MLYISLVFVPRQVSPLMIRGKRFKFICLYRLLSLYPFCYSFNPRIKRAYFEFTPATLLVPCIPDDTGVTCAERVILQLHIK
jgi:hypothetical protein